jgi:hypothetical protein
MDSQKPALQRRASTRASVRGHHARGPDRGSVVGKAPEAPHARSMTREARTRAWRDWFPPLGIPFCVTLAGSSPFPVADKGTV